MFDYIKTLNQMYDENPCTNDGRVMASYCSSLNAVVIKVFGNYKVIEVNAYTDWGLLNKIQDTVREMYEAV